MAPAIYLGFIFWLIPLSRIGVSPAKLCAIPAMMRRAYSLPIKKDPVGPSICTQTTLLSQPALDCVGAVFSFPFLKDFMVAAFRLDDFT